MNELKIRELVWDDVYVAAKILKPLKVDVDGIDEVNDSGLKAGITVFKNMIAHAGDAKDEINEFLGSLFDITGDEFGNLPLFTAGKCMKQFKELDGFEDFFRSVKDMMK